MLICFVLKFKMLGEGSGKNTQCITPNKHKTLIATTETINAYLHS